MLKSIELIGFKSFAKRGKLDFTAPVTAIVGPNGSGKSNTAEAFRFVLGEQGGKVLRVKKGADLIWSGSKAVPKASRAGVRLVLDNSAGNLNIDYNEVVLERSVLADGTHEYYINGSRARLKDIQDLLSGANIGSSGHHIISQGQADRILAATPKERREMLEDALGLKGYILRKAEAERKLAATSENLAQAQAAERELLPKLKYLKRQAAAVEEAKELAKELESQFARYAYAEQTWLDAEFAELKQSMSAPQEELSEIDTRITQLRERLVAAEQEAPAEVDVSRELQALELKVKETQAELETAKQEQGKVLGQIELLGNMQEHAEQRPEVVPREAVRAILLKVVDTLESAGKQTALEGVLEYIGRAREQADKFINNVLDAGGQATARQEDAQQERRLSELQEGRGTLEQNISELRKRLSHLQEELAVKQQEQEGAKQQSTTLERDIYKEVARRNEVANILAGLEQRLSAAKARQAQLTEDVAEVEALLGKHIEPAGQEGATVPERREVERLKVRVESTAGISYEVLDEYKAVQDEYEHLSSQVQDLSVAAGKLAELMAALDKQARESFSVGLSKINKEFGEFFSLLFGGGGAKLEVEGSTEDEAKPGVHVSVQLPRKRVTTLETLSGGERALASIALIFAMSQVNPPPFIILDETDAALDEANSRRYAEVVQRLSGKSQVILITHNRATMSVADTLYGVTMGGDGVSQLLSVHLKDAEQYAK